MKRKILFKILPVLLGLSLLLFGVTGCGYESLVLDLLGDWADVHDVNPSTAGGAVNLAERAASGSTGDEEADAAIGLKKTINDIRQGDKLMGEAEELRTEGKLDDAAKKMDEAIKKRPDDWSYRASRTVVAIEQSDSKNAQTQIDAAYKSLGTQPVFYAPAMSVRNVVPHPNLFEEYNYYTQLINTLESSNFKLKDMDQETKKVYYRALESAYMGRYEVNGKSGYSLSSANQHVGDLAAAQQYAGLYQAVSK